MGRTKAEAIGVLVAILLVAWIAGACIGYGVAAGVYRESVGELERGLAEAQGRVGELEGANRELAERQRNAQDIIERTGRNLAEASGAVDRIEQLIDRIIATVEDLERAYRVLDGF